MKVIVCFKLYAVLKKSAAQIFYCSIGNVLPELTFELLERDRHGAVVVGKYKGPFC